MLTGLVLWLLHPVKGLRMGPGTWDHPRSTISETLIELISLPRASPPLPVNVLTSVLPKPTQDCLNETGEA